MALLFPAHVPIYTTTWANGQNEQASLLLTVLTMLIYLIA